ncbi:MAG: hypothetical protein AAB690_02625 [Patescibacteria group bacterium]
MFEGEKFLHQKNPKLHTEAPIEHEQGRKKTAGEKTTQKPAEKLSDWMSILERTHTGHRDDPKVPERIKESYYNSLVIDSEEIPESYFENQRRLARERGHGDIEITEKMRSELAEVIITDQKSTLNLWLDYLTHPDADIYPMWAKYWVFTNITRLSSYDKEKKQFSKRDKGTVAPFPDLNREALAYVIDVIVKKTEGKKLDETEDNEELQKLLSGANFGKLYAWAIEKITPAEESELQNTKGEWIKYNKNSDHTPLVESLQGHGTGWCTAGESTAETQLKTGDFYVYYSYDKSGNPTIPRVAIRMEGNHIAEVRGIAPDQNLDSYIGEVVRQKLREFPDGLKYEKKEKDMRHLTVIGNKVKKREDFTEEDLRFIYEIDSKIEGFGYEKDPRIKEILSDRNVREDFSLIFGFPPDKISSNRNEALSGNILFHYGNLNLSGLTSAEGLTLPQSISGSLNLSGLTSAEGLTLPQSIRGSLNFPGLTSAKGLILPQSIGGSLDLSGLTSAKDLTLPQSIGGSLYLSGLTSVEGLTLPQSIGEFLHLPGLTSAEGLSLPQSIRGSLYFPSLTSAEGLTLPQSISGSLDLSGLTSAEGLTLPQSIGGGLTLSHLTFADKEKLRKQYPHLANKI